MTWWSLVHFQGDITKACGASILGAALVVLACIDHRTGLLPDMLTLPLLWVGLLLNADALYVSPPQAIWGAAAGYLVPWLFAHGYQAMTGREGLGQGDAKLLAALGAWLGADALLPILFLASVLGIVVFLARIVFLRTAWRAPAPFGPFLALNPIVILRLTATLSRSLLAFGQLQG
jgi:leader peptidase (prepilin peptidase)/N-methyltransferase